MNQDKYNLNWHTYSDHLRDMLHEMLMSKELTDVTLVCDDKRQLKAHKIVLSACSSVFKKIINDLPQNSSVIYLRGIQHQEMESILEFMYLGVTTFYQERMGELLNVAKNLEIKEIGKNVNVDCDEGDVKNDDLEISETNLELESEIDNSIADGNDYPSYHTQISNQSHAGGMFDCQQCQKKFTTKGNLKTHFQSEHEGVKYACNQCDYQATQQSSLSIHIKSKHEGVKSACNQCDQQFALNS